MSKNSSTLDRRNQTDARHRDQARLHPEPVESLNPPRPQDQPSLPPASTLLAQPPHPPLLNTLQPPVGPHSPYASRAISDSYQARGQQPWQGSERRVTTTFKHELPASESQSSYPQHHSHLPLYPQRASYQARNPGTVYEPITPGTQQDFASTAGSSGFQGPSPTRATRRESFGERSSISNRQSFNDSQHNVSTKHDNPGPLPSGSLLSKPANDMHRRYRLRIRQQPIAARACGYGERDRRVIDPPPIVQFHLHSFDPDSSNDVSELQHPFNIVMCFLLNASPQEVHHWRDNKGFRSEQYGPSTDSTVPPLSSEADITVVRERSQSDRLTRRLMGTNVASPFTTLDPEMSVPARSQETARLATFFVFPDLSCRQNGHYRLRFTLMRTPVGPDVAEGAEGEVFLSADSDVFEVFSAKDFPGMRPSTFLTKELKNQGAAISVKKGKGFERSGRKTATTSGAVGGESSTRDSRSRTGSGSSRGPAVLVQGETEQAMQHYGGTEVDEDDEAGSAPSSANLDTPRKKEKHR